MKGSRKNLLPYRASSPKCHSGLSHENPKLFERNINLLYGLKCFDMSHLHGVSLNVVHDLHFYSTAPSSGEIHVCTLFLQETWHMCNVGSGSSILPSAPFLRFVLSSEVYPQIGKRTEQSKGSKM